MNIILMLHLLLQVLADKGKTSNQDQGRPAPPEGLLEGVAAAALRINRSVPSTANVATPVADHRFNLVSFPSYVSR